MDPFPALVSALQSANGGVAGPRVCDPEGRMEDSARRFPTVATLLRKFLAGTAGPDYPVDGGLQEVDWVAGMFMLFRSDAYREAGGFDERFFLYYEDVDICRRLRLRGHRCLFQPEASVIHDARRASRRDLRLMRIHASSAARYLTRRYR
jgi:GT2 family glycosyltransferase